MDDLNKRAIAGILRFLICLGALLFLPAWTLDYWPAWVFLGVFSASVVAITAYLMKNDRKLLERRMNAGPGAEKEKSQKIIQTVTMILFITVVVFPGIDHRFGWSMAPPYVAIFGDVLVAAGFVVVFIVFKENSFTAGTIEVDPGQKVVSTGPYAVVPHPMYAGALVMLLGIPLALGSRWGLLTIIPITLAIVWRLLEEEKFLAKKLPGYSEYRSKVKYRVVPLVW